MKGKKFSKSGKNWRQRGAEPFRQARAAFGAQLGEQIRIVEKNPKLHEFYLKLMSTFKTKGDMNWLKSVRNAVEETKKFAEENNIPWRL